MFGPALSYMHRHLRTDAKRANYQNPERKEGSRARIRGVPYLDAGFARNRPSGHHHTLAACTFTRYSRRVGSRRRRATPPP